MAEIHELVCTVCQATIPYHVSFSVRSDVNTDQEERELLAKEIQRLAKAVADHSCANMKQVEMKSFAC